MKQSAQKKLFVVKNSEKALPVQEQPIPHTEATSFKPVAPQKTVLQILRAYFRSPEAVPLEFQRIEMNSRSQRDAKANFDYVSSSSFK